LSSRVDATRYLSLAGLEPIIYDAWLVVAIPQ